MTSAERIRRLRERRRGICPACNLVCLKCGMRSVDTRGRFVDHICSNPDAEVLRSKCEECREAARAASRLRRQAQD